MRKLLFSILLILIIAQLPAYETESTKLHKWTGKDKVMHFAGSAYLTYWNYNFNRDILSKSHSQSLRISVSFTTLLGFGKETSDKHLKSTGFSWYDIAYDIAGIGLGMIIINNTR